VGKMSTKTLSLSEEVYARLDAERKEGESFNEVIIRLTKKKSLKNIVGFFKERDAEEMWTVIEEMREKSRDRTLRIIEETE
jgi:pentatricopeptide repeat protein